MSKAQPTGPGALSKSAFRRTPRRTGDRFDLSRNRETEHGHFRSRASVASALPSTERKRSEATSPGRTNAVGACCGVARANDCRLLFQFSPGEIRIEPGVESSLDPSKVNQTKVEPGEFSNLPCSCRASSPWTNAPSRSDACRTRIDP